LLESAWPARGCTNSDLTSSTLRTPGRKRVRRTWVEGQGQYNKGERKQCESLEGTRAKRIAKGWEGMWKRGSKATVPTGKGANHGSRAEGVEVRDIFLKVIGKC